MSRRQKAADDLGQKLNATIIEAFKTGDLTSEEAVACAFAWGIGIYLGDDKDKTPEFVAQECLEIARLVRGPSVSEDESMVFDLSETGESLTLTRKDEPKP